MSLQRRILGILIPLGLCASAFGEIINVPDHYSTIQAAIDAAADADEIIVAPGTYFEKVNMLGKVINLHSSDGPDVTTIDAAGSGTVVKGGVAGAVINGFTITGGSASFGGGMYNVNSPTVTNCTFIENEASFGGGMWNAGSSTNPKVTNCAFVDNSATDGGGMNGPATVTNCLFIGNSATFGGGISVRPNRHITVTNSTIIGNYASHGGGIWYNGNQILTMTNSIVWTNSLSGNGIADVRYSDVQGGWDGVGNFSADPLFFEPAKGDYRLSAGSPCTDAGNSAAAHSVSWTVRGTSELWMTC